MVKSQRKTRKLNTRKAAGAKKSVLSIPQLRKAFDHMDSMVEKLRKTAKHSFSDAVITYRNEWRKTFKHDLSPADASAYLKFRYGMKSKQTRRSKTRGGSMGAPLDYQMRPGMNGVYGQFPSYQQEGLDRYYGSALSADCGKPNGFPTDGSAASQAGGSWNALFRPIQPYPPPSNSLPYTTQMVNIKGTAPYPPTDPTGPAAQQLVKPFVFTSMLPSSVKTFGSDVYSTSGTSPAGSVPSQSGWSS
jgi:hypothetical protein